MNKKLDLEIRLAESEVVRSLQILVQKIESGRGTPLERELAKELLCEVNKQITACPIMQAGEGAKEEVPTGADDETTILPAVKIGIFILVALFCFGCTSTKSHRENHQASINENEYVSQYLAENGDNIAKDLLPHMIQQGKHLKTTQEWLGHPDEPVPHDHAIQESVRAGAESDNESRGIITQIWEGASSNWPWLGALGGLGGLALRLLRKGSAYKRAFTSVVHGVQDAKSAAGKDGKLSRGDLNDAITVASTAMRDAKFRDEFKGLLENIKTDYEEIRKEIKDYSGSNAKSKKSS
jgi:hypothetical protein